MFSHFPSQILVCATAFTAYYLSSRYDICWDIKQKHKKCKKIYRHKSMHVSKPSRLLTNHSWQVWRFIYNNHTDVKIFPTKIQVHKEQAKLVNAQSHLYGGTRLNMCVTKHKNADQNFWIFYFLCVFGFLTQSKDW